MVSKNPPSRGHCADTERSATMSVDKHSRRGLLRTVLIWVAVVAVGLVSLEILSKALSRIDSERQASFDSIKVGMSEQNVRAALGKPILVESKLTPIRGYWTQAECDAANTSGATKWLIYDNTFAIGYAIGIDDKGVVVIKLHGGT